MKIVLMVMFVALVSFNASAQRPPYPDQGQGQGQYQNQYQDQYLDQQDQGRWEDQRRPMPPHCQGRCAPPPRCPRTSCQPPQRVPDCQVIMLDCNDRMIYRYPGLADYPSGFCSGPMHQCNLDIRREGQYGARCVQTRR
jgi:hypothetical protein